MRLGGRVPQGTRGLKLKRVVEVPALFSRVPQGTRGLKYCDERQDLARCCRVPQGTRGLKYLGDVARNIHSRVASRKGRVG